MDREDVLRRARNEKDERELLIKNKAYKIAGEVSFTCILVMAIYFLIDTYILNNITIENPSVISAILIMTGCIYVIIEELYLLIRLKLKRKIVSVIIFGYIAINMFTKIICDLFL